METLVEVLAQGTLAQGAEVAFEDGPSTADLLLTSVDVEVPEVTAGA